MLSLQGGDGGIDRSEARDTPADSVAIKGRLGCLELAQRKPSWPAATPHKQAGHMKANDRSRISPHLASRGSSTYESGSKLLILEQDSDFSRFRPNHPALAGGSQPPFFVGTSHCG